MKITKIYARQILDSRGNPTLETAVWSNGACAKASVPSGASTGIHEAMELRDEDKKKYSGKGVLKACRNVNEKISKALKGVSAKNQAQVDKIMLELDGTENKRKLGANAILSVSLAAAKLAAKLQKNELYKYLAELYGYEIKKLPTPLFNVINGGAHADSGLDVQEYFIIPEAGKFSEKLRMGAEVYQTLKKELLLKGFSVGVGDEGGFAPRLGSNEIVFKFLQNAVLAAGYKMGEDFKLGVDVAASEFFDAKKQVYNLKADKKSFKSTQIYKMYKQWLSKYHLAIIEDGCAEDDIIAWKLLNQEIGEKTALVGDDLFCTNIKRIQMGVQQKLANAAVIKVNQIGSLTETIQAIKFAQSNKYKLVISHRSGETNETFMSDLAVAVNAEYIKAGAPCRGERLAKYNRLLEIEEELN